MVRGILSILIAVLALPAGQAQEDEKTLQANPAEDLFTLATVAYEEALGARKEELKREYFETALRQFARLREAYPQHDRIAESWYFSAVCHDKLGNGDAALASLNKVVESKKEGPLAGTAAMQVGARQYQAGNFAEAAAAFQVAGREHEDKSSRQTALYQRALCFEKLGRDEELTAALETVVADEDSPYRRQAREVLAHHLRKQGQPEKALEHFRALMESGDADARSRAILTAAVLARELGLGEETTRLFQRILETAELKKWHGEAQLFLMGEAAGAKNHEQVIALFERGRFPLKKKQTAQRLLLAIRAHESVENGKDTTPLYRELQKIAPEARTRYEAGYILLSRAFSPKEGGRKAAKFSREARRFITDHEGEPYADSRLDSVRLMLAETEYQAQHFARAAEAYAAIELSSVDESNHAGIRFHLASALRKAGREKEADQALAEFLEHHPDDPRVPPALARRADRLARQGKHEAALADFERALGLSDDPALAEYIWGRKAAIFKDQEDLPSLKAAHEYLLASFPERTPTATAASFFWLGWAQFRLEELPGAIDAFRRARTIDPESFSREATVHLALAHYTLEQLDELQQEVERLDREHPRTNLPRPVYAWLGTRLTAAEEHEEAWRYLPRAVAGTEDGEIATGVWLAHARSAFATGHLREATESYAHLLSRETNAFRQAEYHYQLARCWHGREDLARATGHAEDALALKPQGELNGRVRLLLGKLAADSGDPETAVQHYVVVAELFSDDAETRREALTRAIAILETKGRPEDLAQAEEYRQQLDSP